MASSTEGLFDVGSCTLNTLHGARVDQMRGGLLFIAALGLFIPADVRCFSF